MLETISESVRSVEIVTPQKELIIAGDRRPCIGVNMALDTTTKVLDLVKGREDVFANHDPVHNDPILKEYKKRGLVIEPDIQRVPFEAIYIFSAHGVRPSEIERAMQRGLKIANVECTYVTKDRREVGRAIEGGFYVVFFGSKVLNRETGEKVWHPEPIATLGDYDRSAYSLINVNADDEIDEEDDDPADIPIDRPIRVFSQTTLSTVQILKRRDQISTNLGIELPDPMGICYATDNRQTALREGIFGDPDKIPSKLVVIGSGPSNNTGELTKIGVEKIGEANTRQIDTVEELSEDWLESAPLVGLTSGASVLDRFTTPVIEWFAQRAYRLNLLPSTEKGGSLRGPDLSELEAHLQQKYPEAN